MNTFKTIVVMSTLLGLGYGAHVILNKPVASRDGSFAVPDGWANPHVQFDNTELSASSPPNLMSPENPANPFSKSPPLQAAANEPAIVWPTSETTAPAVASPQTTLDSNSPTVTSLVAGPVAKLPTSGQPASYASVPAGQPDKLNVNPSESDLSANAATSASLPKAPPIVGSADTPQDTLDSADSIFPRESDFPDAAPAVSPDEVLAAEASNPLTPVHDSAFEDMWSSLQAKLQRDELTDGLFSLSLWYNDPHMTSQQRDVVVPLLDQLAGTVIYSHQHRLEPQHIVANGETLEQIAKFYEVAPAFLARVNGLDVSPVQALPEASELKVVRGPFRAELSLRRREITVFLGRYYAGRFSVGIGREFPTQLGTMRVTETDGARPYREARTGQQIAAGAANNPYGSHWIGLQATTGAPHLTEIGVHRSGADIDASDTRGYVSLSDRDMDDLQALLSVGSAFTVID